MGTWISCVFVTALMVSRDSYRHFPSLPCLFKALSLHWCVRYLPEFLLLWSLDLEYLCGESAVIDGWVKSSWLDLFHTEKIDGEEMIPEFSPHPSS